MLIMLKRRSRYPEIEMNTSVYFKICQALNIFSKYPLYFGVILYWHLCESPCRIRMKCFSGLLLYFSNYISEFPELILSKVWIYDSIIPVYMYLLYILLSNKRMNESWKAECLGYHLLEIYLCRGSVHSNESW